MGQKDANPNGDHRLVAGSIFPFTKPGFFSYAVFLTHSQQGEEDETKEEGQYWTPFLFRMKDSLNSTMPHATSKSIYNIYQYMFRVERL